MRKANIFLTIIILSAALFVRKGYGQDVMPVGVPESNNVSAAVMVDISGSVYDPEHQTAKQIMESLSSLSQEITLDLTLVGFNDFVSSTRENFMDFLNNLTNEGNTDLEKALSETIALLNETPAGSQKVLFLLTDGGVNLPDKSAIPSSEARIRELAANSGIRIIPVYWASEEGEPRLLLDIANSSGGCFLTSSENNLSQEIADIVRFLTLNLELSIVNMDDAPYYADRESVTEYSILLSDIPTENSVLELVDESSDKSRHIFTVGTSEEISQTSFVNMTYGFSGDFLIYATLTNAYGMSLTSNELLVTIEETPPVMPTPTPNPKSDPKPTIEIIPAECTAKYLPLPFIPLAWGASELNPWEYFSDNILTEAQLGETKLSVENSNPSALSVSIIKDGGDNDELLPGKKIELISGEKIIYKAAPGELKAGIGTGTITVSAEYPAGQTQRIVLGVKLVPAYTELIVIAAAALLIIAAIITALVILKKRNAGSVVVYLDLIGLGIPLSQTITKKINLHDVLSAAQADLLNNADGGDFTQYDKISEFLIANPETEEALRDIIVTVKQNVTGDAAEKSDDGNYYVIASEKQVAKFHF